MAITPSVLIAATGLINGQGIGISPAMTQQLARYAANGLTSMYNTFTSGSVTDATGNVVSYGNLTTSSGQPLSTVMGSLPSFFNDAQSTLNSIQAQASSLLPGGPDGIKKFISTFNIGTGFTSAAAEWGGALKEFSGKSFGDLGININKFSDIATNGVSDMFKGIKGQLPDLGSIPGAGMLQQASQLAKENISQVGAALGKLGTAFDASNLSALGDPRALINNLSQQGLGNVGGINDKLLEMGLDPSNLLNATDAQLKKVLSSVQGSDLQKIIKQTGMKLPDGVSMSSLHDFMDASKVLGQRTASILPGGNLAGLGNALGNLGGSFKDINQLSAMLKGIEVPSIPHLDSLSTLVPPTVMSTLGPYMSGGTGLDGIPTMNDLVGTVAGVAHTDNFRKLSQAVEGISASSIGASLQTSMDNLKAALQSSANPGSDPAVQSALDAVASNVTNFNTQAASNADLSSLLTSAQASISSSVSQLQREASNLASAGVDLLSSAPRGISSILGFSGKLHMFGVDKQSLGLGSLVNGIASNDVYGDAIRMALIEGRNMARQMKVSVPVPTKADPDATRAASAAEAVPDLEAYATVTEDARAAALLDYQRNPSDAMLAQKFNDMDAYYQEAQADLTTTRRTAGDALA